MNFNCPNCGKIDHILIDGYEVGDRLLEDVKFRVSEKNGKTHAELAFERDRAYFDDLNTAKWLKAVEEYAEELDVVGCPNCNEEIIFNEDEREVTPIAVPCTNIMDVLRGQTIPQNATPEDCSNCPIIGTAECNTCPENPGDL